MIYKKNWKYILKKEIVDKKYHPKALKDFSDVLKGDLGGCVDRYCNLSQSGDCWIYDKSMVFGFAEVTRNAIVKEGSKVFEHARVSDNAKIIWSVISGHAEISDNAEVINSRVSENAKVCENSIVDKSTLIYGYAEVSGHAHIIQSTIRGNAKIDGNSKIFNKTL